MAKGDYTFEILKLIREASAPVGAACLSERLEIPQATIGRRLAKLEADGLLEKVSNLGRSITPQGVAYLENMHIHNQKLATANKLIKLVQDVSKERLFEVLEVRLMLETQTARLAAQKITTDGIQRLDDILFDHVYEVKHGGTGSEGDLRLHLCIAKLSGNATLYQLLKLLLMEDNVYTRFSTASASLTGVQLQQHGAVVEAIKQGDPDGAARSMADHLEKVICDVKMYY